MNKQIRFKKNIQNNYKKWLWVKLISVLVMQHVIVHTFILLIYHLINPSYLNISKLASNPAGEENQT